MYLTDFASRPPQTEAQSSLLLALALLVAPSFFFFFTCFPPSAAPSPSRNSCSAGKALPPSTSELLLALVRLGAPASLLHGGGLLVLLGLNCLLALSRIVFKALCALTRRSSASTRAASFSNANEIFAFCFLCFLWPAGASSPPPQARPPLPSPAPPRRPPRRPTR